MIFNSEPYLSCRSYSTEYSYIQLKVSEVGPSVQKQMHAGKYVKQPNKFVTNNYYRYCEINIVVLQHILTDFAHAPIQVRMLCNTVTCISPNQRSI